MAVQLNLQALTNSGYKAAPVVTVGQRVVHRYTLQDTRSEDQVTRGANAVRQLIQDNQSLCPTFAMNDDIAFKQMVKKCIHLVINQLAVCLSDKPKATNVDPKYVDKYFSESLPKEPVQCSQGHILEKAYAQFWHARFNGNCPANALGQHAIGQMIIDTELQHDINTIEQDRKETEQKEEENVNRAKVASLRSEMALSHRTKLNTTRIVCGSGKIVVKIATELTLKYGGKFVTAGTFKVVSKWIPGVSLAVGISMGIYRFSQGQWVSGLVEMVSGGVACIPGGGILASMAIDAGLLIYDANNEGDVVLAPNLEQAHKFIGLDYDPNVRPTKEAIIAAYHQQSKLIHPDKLSSLGEYSQEQCSQLQQMLNDSKEALLKHYKYT